ncbi:MAG: biotin/lipoyl-containing protein [Candidatus Aminicenantales bacterium]
MDLSFWLNSKEFRLRLTSVPGDGIEVSLGRKTYHVRAEFLSAEEILLNIDGRVYNVIVESDTTSYSVVVNGRSYRIEKASMRQILGEKPEKKRRAEVRTSMPGKIVKVLLGEGDRVDEGQAVLILEAMKMQNEIKSPQKGRIVRVGPQPGDSIETGALLFIVE